MENVIVHASKKKENLQQLQTSKWKFELTGPHKNLEYMFIYF